MAGQTETLDQQNLSGSTGIGFGDTGSNRDYMCQGFIARLTNVSAISFYVTSKDGDANNRKQGFQ